MKKFGNRDIPRLYTEIRKVLTLDEKDGNYGMTSYALSRAIGCNNMTCGKYLTDLEKDEKVTSKKVSNMTLFRITEAGRYPGPEDGLAEGT
jgi:hypothetical protein